jgi:hypothetical protein
MPAPPTSPGGSANLLFSRFLPQEICFVFRGFPNCSMGGLRGSFASPARVVSRRADALVIGVPFLSSTCSGGN